MMRAKPSSGRASRIRNPAKKGKYARVKVVAVALFTNSCGPFLSLKISNTGSAIAVAKTKPSVPSNHVA